MRQVSIVVVLPAIDPDGEMSRALRAAGLRVTMPRLAMLTWLAGHPARLERRVGDHHHHLVCRRCGRTEDAFGVTGAQPGLIPAQDVGFAVDEAEVVFWGVPRLQSS